ncbi:MAG: GntR family transcriptional regulator [Deltaproteobacteria bacterium]|jgi:DNA-binding GntR family transcriptional regulator|nr:GntR family transcriptional regulator [Deltaproteobacteria bacterium]MCW8893504.1 GntR family transcriptional regulator [Deltaproteobacteria bacterium]
MPIPESSRPINRFSMREEVYSTLLGWIMEGELRPGEKLLDKDLAEKMGVSRTPVREALRRLEDKELVESSANRWTRVAEISLEEPEMIYPILWTLEELAVAQALENLTVEDFHRMETANAALEKALIESDPVSASRADSQFHDVYIERSHNHFLIAILQDLKIRYRRIEVAYFEGSACAMDSVAEHKLILEAFRSGELLRIQSMIRTNWQSSLGRLKDIEKRAEIDRLSEISLHPQS